jgi:hypothetical protein
LLEFAPGSSVADNIQWILDPQSGVLDQIMLQLSDFSVGCESNINNFFRAMRKFLDCLVLLKIGVFYWRLYQEVF